MSITAQLTIWCDKCENWILFDTRSPREAASEVKSLGWKVKKVGGRTLHYCRNCARLDKYLS